MTKFWNHLISFQMTDWHSYQFYFKLVYLQYSMNNLAKFSVVVWMISGGMNYVLNQE